MKNLFIIYNVIFLSFGNVLFSNIHYFHHHHHHSTEVNEEHECQECIIIESSNNCITDYLSVNFSNNFNSSLSVFNHSGSIQSYIKELSQPRAPPIS